MRKLNVEAKFKKWQPFLSTFQIKCKSEPVTFTKKYIFAKILICHRKTKKTGNN